MQRELYKEYKESGFVGTYSEYVRQTNALLDKVLKRLNDMEKTRYRF